MKSKKKLERNISPQQMVLAIKFAEHDGTSDKCLDWYSEDSVFDVRLGHQLLCLKCIVGFFLTKIGQYSYLILTFIFSIYYHPYQDSSIGIATCYGLDRPGIESHWGRDIPHPSRQALEPTQPPI
jgi:hypothetical protein